MGRYSVIRYLKSLVEEKILICKKEANLTLYSLNWKNSLVILLIASFDKQRNLKIPLNVRKVLDEIRRKIDNYFIVVFGSYAKGTYKKGSDLDVFVCVKDKCLIKKKEFIKKLELQYGVRIDLHIGQYENTPEQKHIIETGLPISNFENFYEVYYGE